MLEGPELVQIEPNTTKIGGYTEAVRWKSLPLQPFPWWFRRMGTRVALWKRNGPLAIKRRI